MSPQNRAAWLIHKQDEVHVVKDAPYNKPDANELVMKTKAVAINPADVAVQKLGIIVDIYPAILGCDAAGIVEEVGSGITDFKPGDRVMGATQPLPGGIFKHSGFQEYVLLRYPLIAKIPNEANFTDASVLPLAINTSSSCLFHESTLALQMPPSHAGKEETLLIWGASSSIGSCGVQLAAAAGYEVFGVASGRNHAFIKSIGAAQAFDQNDPHIVADIVAALKGKTCVGAYDAISQEETLHAICDIIHESGGRKLITAIRPGAESNTKNDVIIKTNFACQKFESAVGKQISRVFLEPAIASSAFQFKPQADIVGHGLEDIQKGCDLLAQGVSAKKLAISL